MKTLTRSLSWVMLAGLAATAAMAQRFVPTADPKYPRLKYADSLVSLNDRCAVRKYKLSARVRPVYVNGEPVGFCCTSCPPIFFRRPEPYLKDFPVVLPDPVDSSRQAVVDSSLRLYVGQDVLFFADAKSMRTFEADPLRYCKVLTDPVSGVRFRPTPHSPEERYRGRHYYFDSDSTRVAFDRTPDRFWVRR